MTSAIYIHPKALEQGPKIQQRTAQSADIARPALDAFISNLLVDRDRLAAQIEETFDSILAVSAFENLALIAAKAADLASDSELLSKAGMALKAMFLLEWPLLSPEQCRRIAGQALGFIHIVSTDAPSGSAANAFALLAETSIKIELDRAKGKAVYADPHLIVCTESCLREMQPELYVGVPHRLWHIWSFMPLPEMNRLPPLSSLKAAKRAIKNWSGPKLSGQLMGDDSARLCQLLGLKVRSFHAYLEPRSKGFA